MFVGVRNEMNKSHVAKYIEYVHSDNYQPLARQLSVLPISEDIFYRPIQQH